VYERHCAAILDERVRMLPAKASNSCPGRLHPAHSEEPIYNCSFRNLKATASLPMFALGSCDGQSASCVKTRIMEPASLKSMPRLPDRDFTCRGGDLRPRGDRRGDLVVRRKRWLVRNDDLCHSPRPQGVADDNHITVGNAATRTA
jgi:hypothetical protein